MAINTKHSSINSIERYIETFITRIVNAKLKALNKDNQMEGVVETRSSVNQNLSEARAAAADKDPEERTEEENALLNGSVTLEDSDTLNEAVGKLDWMLGERVTYNDIGLGDTDSQESGNYVADADTIAAGLYGDLDDEDGNNNGSGGNVADPGDITGGLFDDLDDEP